MNVSAKMTKTGICNWPKNRLYWGRHFKRRAALPSKKLTQVPPLPGGGGVLAGELGHVVVTPGPD